MASRSAVKAIDWKMIFDRTPPNLRSQVGNFKNKSDTIMSNHAKAQASVSSINWEHYENAIDNKELVASFKAKFEALEIPKPVDTKTKDLLAQAEKDKATYNSVVAKFKSKEDKLNGEIERLCSLPPFEQMTMADINKNFPLLSFDTKNRGYTDMRANTEKAEFTMIADPSSNVPDVGAYIADLKAKAAK